jgi:hypothetical protein
LGKLKGDKIIMTTKKSKVSKEEVKSKKKVAKKAKVTKKSTPIKTKAKAVRSNAAKKPKKQITPDERLEMIRTAAYYLAEKRGYQGSDELADWFMAEKEVDALTSSDF